VAFVLSTSIVHSLVTAGVPISEKILRTAVVYLFIFLLLRLFGKRTAAQLNSFDLVVLLLLSNVVQNAIIGPDNSLVGGLIGAAALVLVNEAAVRFLRRRARIDRAIEGDETRLVENGHFTPEAMRRLGIRQSDLEVALRRQGAENVRQVKTADLYPSGAVLVNLEPGEHGATHSDIQRMDRKLDALMAAVTRSPGPPA
jgi:uncharacterized membrane protein YcaP (DUF421 family)